MGRYNPNKYPGGAARELNRQKMKRGEYPFNRRGSGKNSGYSYGGGSETIDGGCLSTILTIWGIILVMMSIGSFITNKYTDGGIALIASAFCLLPSLLYYMDTNSGRRYDSGIHCSLCSGTGTFSGTTCSKCNGSGKRQNP